MPLYIHANPNPIGKYVDDCVIRAIAIATNRTWDDVYAHVCLQGYIMKNMPSVNKVWGTYLSSIGFVELPILADCPDCYTVKDFCNDNREGIFILATGSHVICSIDGNYYDTWDSGDELPVSVWRKE